MKTLNGLLMGLLCLISSFGYLQAQNPYSGSAPYCLEGGGLMINEVSQGNGNQEYVELLVIGDPANPTAPVDLTGFLIDDNNLSQSMVGNATGHFILGDCYSAVPPGSLIVLYNGNDPNPAVPAVDPTDSDGDNVYIINGSGASSCVEACNSNPAAPGAGGGAVATSNFCPCEVAPAPTLSWQIGMSNGGDLIHVRNNCETVLHALTWESSMSPDVDGAPVTVTGFGNQGGSVISFTDGDWSVFGNYDVGAVPGDQTPGAPNNAANTTFIANVAAGSAGCNGTIADCDQTDAGDITLPNDITSDLIDPATGLVTLCSGDDYGAFGVSWDAGDESAPNNAVFNFDYAIMLVGPSPSDAIIDYLIPIDDGAPTGAGGNFDLATMYGNGELAEGETYCVYGFSYYESNDDNSVEDFLTGGIGTLQDIIDYDDCGYAYNLENQTDLNQAACFEVVPNVVADASGPAEYCAGNTYTLNGNPSGGSNNTYNWTTTGGSLVAPTDAVDVDIDLTGVAPGTAITVTFEVESEDGCTDSFDLPISVTGQDLSFSYDAASYCEGGSPNPIPTATTPPLPSGSYSSNDAALVVDATTGEIDLASSTEGNYTVTYTSSTGSTCDGSFDVAVEITPQTQPILIQGVDIVCELDGAINLDDYLAAGTTGGVWGGDATGSSFDVTAAGAGDYNMTYGAAVPGPCDAEAAFLLRVLPTPSATVTMTESVCGSEVLTLSDYVTAGDMSGYWTDATGATITEFDPANYTASTSETLTYHLDQSIIACPDLGIADPLVLCTTDVIPVCGCDGNTYNNGCEALEQNGVIYAAGACDGTNQPSVPNIVCDVTYDLEITIEEGVDFELINTEICVSELVLNLSDPSLYVGGIVPTPSSWDDPDGCITLSAGGDILDLDCALDGNPTPYVYTLTLTAGDLPCQTSETLEITITEGAGFPTIVDLPVCEGDYNLTDLEDDILADPAVPVGISGTFIWYLDDPITTGAAPLSGTDLDVSLVGGNSANYYVEFIDGSGCSAYSLIVITINTIPDITFTEDPINLCGDNSITDLSLYLDTVSPDGEWDTSSGYIDADGIINVESAIQDGVSLIVANYSTGSGICDIDSDIDINIADGPNANWTPPTAVCYDATSPIDLNDWLDADADLGGQWYDDNDDPILDDTSFDFGITVSGNYTLSYEVSSAIATCPSASVELDVPIFIAPALVVTDYLLCEGDQIDDLNSTDILISDTGGDWTLDGGTLVGTTFNPDVFPALSPPYTLTFTPDNGACPAVDLTVDLFTPPNFPSPVQLCAEGGAIDLDDYLPVTPVYTGTWSSSNVAVDILGSSFDNPQDFAGETVEITFTIAAGDACEGSYSFDMELTGALSANFVDNGPICFEDFDIDMNTFFTPDTPGGTWSVDAVDIPSGLLNPNDYVGVSEIDVTYTLAAVGDCPAPAPFTLPISIANIVDASWESTSLCTGSGSIDLDDLLNGAGVAGTWSGPGITGSEFDPGADDVDAGWVELTFEPFLPPDSCPTSPFTNSILVVQSGVAVLNTTTDELCSDDGLIDLSSYITTISSNSSGYWTGADEITGNFIDVADLGGTTANLTLTVYDNSCIDPSAINPDLVCPAVFLPVCGCDGITYGNDCEAGIAGVISWVDGECPNGGIAVCTESYTLDLDIADAPIATVDTDAGPLCNDADNGESTIVLSALLEAGTATDGVWTTSDGLITGGILEVDGVTVSNVIATYTVAGTNGCPDSSDETVISISPCTPDCPTVVSLPDSEYEICNGDDLDLSITLSDETDVVVEWSFDGNVVDSDFNFNTGNLENLECASIGVLYEYLVLCPDGSELVSGTVNVLVYPTDVTPFITLNGADTCVTSVLISDECDGALTVLPPSQTELAGAGTGTHIYNFVYDYGASGFDCVPDFTLDITYNCPDECPDFIDLTEPLAICNGDAVTLDADISNEALATIVWTLPDDSTIEGDYNPTFNLNSTDGCEEVVEVAVVITCIQSGEVFLDENVTIDIYPAIEVSFNEIDCGVELVYDNDCADDFDVEWTSTGENNIGLTTEIGDQFIAAPNTSGTVSFTVTNTGAPLGCSSQSFPYDYDCVACPSLISQSVDVEDACEGDIVTFELVLDDPSLAGLVDVTWTGPGLTSTTGLIVTAVATTDNSGCTSTGVAYSYEAICTLDGSTIASPLTDDNIIDINVYPEINATPTVTGCDVELTQDCPEFEISWESTVADVGGMTTGTGTTYEGPDDESGTVTFTIANPSAPPLCSTEVLPLDFDCTVDCPTVGLVSVDETGVCNGGTVNLSAIVSDESTATIEWTLPDNSTANTFTVNDLVLTTTACTETIEIPYVITCTANGLELSAGTLTVGVYPEITATTSVDGCDVSITQDCPEFEISWNSTVPDSGGFTTGTGTDFNGAPDTNGTVIFTVGNIGAPFECSPSTFPVNFDCTVECPTVDSISAPEAVCNGGTVDLLASVSDESTATIEWTLPDNSTANTFAVNDLVLTTTGCTEIIEIPYTITCIGNGIILDQDVVSVTVYPTITASPTVDACNVTLSQDCPEFLFNWQSNVPDIGGFDTGTTNTYNGPEDSNGTVTFTITNPAVGVPADCASEEIPVDFDCTVECPTVDLVTVSETQVCDGSVVNLSATVSDESGASIVWTLPDNSTSNSFIVNDVLLNITGCTEVINIPYVITCIANGVEITSGSIEVTVYPNITYNELVSGCNVSLSSDCPEFVFTWDSGAIPDINGFTTGTGPVYNGSDDSSGTVSFTINNPGAPAGCNSSVIPVDFDCTVECPTVDLVTVSETQVCDGSIVNLSATVSDESGASIVWTLPDNSTSNSFIVNDVLLDITACTEVINIPYVITCIANGVEISSGSVEVTVYSDITYSELVSGCNVSLSSDCPEFVFTWDSGAIPDINGFTTGTGPVYNGSDDSSGTVSFTINNPGAPAGCNSSVIPVDFDCTVDCPTFVSAEVDVPVSCEGETLTFTAEVSSPDDATITWILPDGTTNTNFSFTDTADAEGNCQNDLVYEYEIICTANSTTISTGAINVTVYGDLSNSAYVLEEDGACGPSISSWDCDGVAGFEISNNLDGNGANPDYDALTAPNGNVTFTLTNNNAIGAGLIGACTTSTIEATYSCADCPVVSTPASGTQSFCGIDGTDLSDAAINLSYDLAANVTVGFFLTESNPPITPYTVGTLFPNGMCGSSSTEVFVYLQCDLDGNGFNNGPDDSYIPAGSIFVEVYPDLSTLNANIVMNGECCPSVTAWDCEGEAGFELTNDYAGGGTNTNPDCIGDTGSGNINFIIMNTNAPASLGDACQSVSIPTTYNCTACPQVLGQASGTQSFCGTDATDLTDAVIGLAYESAQGSTELSVGYYLTDGNPPTDPFTPGTLTPTNECDNSSTDVFVYLQCDLDGDGFNGGPDDSYIAAGSVLVEVYPTITAEVTSAIGCLTTISQDCPNYTATYDAGLNGSGDGFSFEAEGGQGGSVEFTVTNPGAPDGCNELIFEAIYDCPAVISCPVFESSDISATDICSGEEVTINIIVDDEGLGTVNWVLPNGIVNDQYSITQALNTLNDCPEEMEISYQLICDETDEIIQEDSFTITVYPPIEPVASDGGCSASVSGFCADYEVTYDDGIGGTGPGSTYNADENTNGTLTFTITNINPNAPAGCSSTTIEADYDCNADCPSFVDATADVADVCEGDQVNFTVNLDDSSLAYIEWTLPDGTVISDPNDQFTFAHITETVCTEEQTYSYTAYCSEDDSVVQSGDFSITVYPSIEEFKENIYATVDLIECDYTMEWCPEFDFNWYLLEACDDYDPAEIPDGTTGECELSGGAGGSVVFQIINTSLNVPLACQLDTLCLPATCPADCSDPTPGEVSESVVCDGDEISFTLNDNTPELSEVNWYLNDIPFTPADPYSFTETINSTGCLDVIFYRYEIICVATGEILLEETFDITVYGILGYSVTEGLCDVTITLDCPEFTVNWTADSPDVNGNTDGDNQSYVIGLGESASVEFTIASECETLTESFDLDCPDDICTELVSEDISEQHICTGDDVTLIVELTDESQSTIEWILPDGNSTGETTDFTFTHTTSTICTEDQSISYTVYCDGEVIVSGSFDFTVYPDIQTSFTYTGGGCMGEVTVDCPELEVQWFLLESCSDYNPSDTPDGFGGLCNIGPGENFQVAYEIINSSPNTPIPCTKHTICNELNCLDECTESMTVTPSTTEACNEGDIDVLVEGAEVGDITWTIDGEIVDFADPANFTYTVNNEDCGVVEVIFAYSITCALTGEIEWEDSFTVNVYPTIDYVLDEIGCNPTVTLNCPEFEMTSDDGVATADGWEFTVPLGEEVDFDFTVTNPLAAAGCDEAQDQLNGFCPEECPELIDTILPNSEICDGENVNFLAFVDDASLALIEWTMPDGEVLTGNNVNVDLFSVSGCNEEVVVNLTITCIADGTIVTDQDIPMSIYSVIIPEIDGENSCIVTVNLNCPDDFDIFWISDSGAGGGNEFPSEPPAVGTVDFFITNPGAPGSCGEEAIVTVPYNCTVTCPTFNGIIADVIGVCDGGEANLETDIDLPNLADIEWTLPSGDVVTDAAINEQVFTENGCTEVLTFSYVVTCAFTGEILGEGTQEITVFPDITATVDNGGCTACISQDCPEFNVEWSDGTTNGAEFCYTAADEGTGEVIFTVTNPGAPDECESAEFTATFDCDNLDCPTLTNAFADITEGCVGDNVDLNVVVDDEDLAEVTWTTPTGDATGFTLTYPLASVSGCTEDVTFSYVLTCVEDGSIVEEDDIIVTVYPLIDATVTNGGCEASVTNDCDEYEATWEVTAGDNIGDTGAGFVYDQALEGESGTVIFTICNPAPEASGLACDCVDFPAAFDCPEIIEPCEVDASTTAPIADLCLGDILNLNELIAGDQGGLWTTTAPAGTIVNDSLFTTDALTGGTYDVTYTVVNTDLVDCEDSSTQSINVIELNTIDAGIAPEVCQGESIDLNGIFSGISGTQWTGGNGIFNDINILNPTYTPSDTEVGEFYLYFSADDLCSSYSDSVLVSIIEAAPLVTSPTVTILEGESVEISVSGGTDYIWSDPSGTLSCTDCPNPIASPVTTTVYQVISADGCSEGSVTVIVIENPNLLVPNAFSPNNDGINDLFRGIPKGVEILSMAVWDRWGVQLFFSQDPDATWDGTYKGEAVDLGVYVYMFEYKVLGEEGETKISKGNVTVVR